jgi:DNA replication protein DnaC
MRIREPRGNSLADYGSPGRGKIADFLLGSIAQRVLMLAEVPVTLVEGSRKLDVAGA